MPELPDITVYIEALEKRILGQRLEGVRIISPFLLRSVEPPVASAAGRKVVELRRMGERICIGLEEEGPTQKSAPTETAGKERAEIWLVLHLMIAGRLHWGAKGKKLLKQHLAAFDFGNGSLLWTEAGSQKRASLHLARGEAGGRVRSGRVGSVVHHERGIREDSAFRKSHVEEGADRSGVVQWNWECVFG